VLDEEVVLELLGVIGAADVSPASGLLAVMIWTSAFRWIGTRRSTRSPSTRPASAARASPFPIRSAT
jgi:hypothetical protein